MTVALPPATAFTGIETFVCPEAKETLEGTVAAEVLLLETASVPEAVGVGDRVAVSVPPAPAFNPSGLGVSAAGLGITTLNTVTVIFVPFAPATETEIELVAFSVTSLSTLVTPPAKLESESTWAPFSFTESAVRLFAALKPTRTMYEVASGGETVKLCEKENVLVLGSVTV